MGRCAALVALLALTLSQTVSGHRPNVKLPDPSWTQDDPNHPVHTLFKRAPADIGSQQWISSLPPFGNPDLSKLPKEWTFALANAMKAGKIPNIPVAAMVPPGATEGIPVYPNGITSSGNQTICSSTDKCQNLGMGDVWEATPGVYAIGFDDGPSPFSPLLLDFAKKVNQKMCHFIIGQSVVKYPKEFKSMVESGGDLAVHTWTHRHMTTLNNLELLAEFGYTMEAIRISTGGKIPKFWRAPYGDSDNRVRAIAMEIFGLRNVMWSHDTKDFQLANAAEQADKGVALQAELDAQFTSWLTGPKTGGLLVLEHETTALSINSFIKAYPAMKQNQWNVLSAVRMTTTGGNAEPYRQAVNVLKAEANTASADTSALAAMNTGVSGGSALNPTWPSAGFHVESPVLALCGSVLAAILGAAFIL